ncbi:DUF1475 family protein [Rariglobus hedericola]|uniref:DUF1475 domain-containing protein n=1 Tax=Rariglobus hedericola TaxID=2597822 RepID=A0A556QGI4_9BACT|nr:DUF1475 family protein [Rariglobus hedericola]TSJ75746.1 DUF1475 domain-containing protein [Rariglobus hedericola]
MLWFLRALFFVVIASMLAVTGWASSQCALFAIPREVFTHPWFIATLFDAYWAFIAFYVWVAWKEQSLAARILWFVAIILWGNLAMALYFLIELFRIQTIDQLGEVFGTRRSGKITLPALLATLGVGVYLLGAQPLFS